MPGIGEKIKRLSLELTRIASTVGTPGETRAAEYIYDYLKKVDYFIQNPENLQLKDLKNDPLNRKYVMAILEGKKTSPGTVLLLGHIDTVGTEDYGDLKEYANDPEILKKNLSQKSFDEEIKKDLKSDNWIFGRGIFDMKTGVASQMVMVEGFSGHLEQLRGNLVFVGVPDEEGNSAGMLTAVQDLAELSKEKGWEFIAAINADYMTGLYAGDENKYVYVGTVGKLLPCFYIYGKETHVGEAFGGLDANLLASELMKEIDLSYDLCDVAGGEATLPPISLRQRDLKTEYSVQTVNAVNLYFNFATHISQPDEVLEKLRRKAVKAFENTIKRLNQNYMKYCHLSGFPYKRLPWQARVLTFEELYRAVRDEKGEEFDSIMEALIDGLLKKGADDREFSLKIVQEVHKHFPDKNPIIVIYFSPPFYPHIFVERANQREEKLLSAAELAVEEARKKYGHRIIIKKFYPYISDLSYCSISKNEESIGKLINNMPAWPKKYSLPVKAIQQISMPVLNIGPYGKDAHKLTERLSQSYSFDAMPLILKKTIEILLN